MFFSSSVQSATSSWPQSPFAHGNVFLADDYDVILNKQMAPKVVTLHKIYDPYVSKNLKREPAVMASWTTWPPHHCLFGRKRSSMSTTSSDAWRQLQRRDWKWEDERFELQEAKSRWLFNFHHHFYDDECNGEMSMNMIVRMKVFQLKCKKEN